jgi:hypothetical protein
MALVIFCVLLTLAILVRISLAPGMAVTACLGQASRLADEVVADRFFSAASASP